MVKTELILINELQTSPTTDDIVLVNCPILEDIAIPVTLQISDVRTPGEGAGSFTKSCSLPGTPEVDKFFENVYDVNVSLQYFNPNLKIKAHYLVEGIPNFEGYLQILKIKVDEVTKTHTYEVNILGQEVTFFTKIKNLLVESLNFSSYSHALTYANIVASWTTPLFSSGIGSGVVYGLADHGTNSSNLQQVRPEDFKPALFYREVLQKIFLAQGYTWTSTFLDSTDFKRKTFTAANFLTVSSTVENNNKFLATADGTQVITEALTVSPLPNVIGTIANNPNSVSFPNETYDTGNIFTANSFTVPSNAKYNISGNLNLSLKVYMNAGFGDVDVTANVAVFYATGVQVGIWNSTYNYTQWIGNTNVQGNVGDLNSNTYNVNINVNNVTLGATQIYYIVLKFSNFYVQYTAPVAGATWSVAATVNSSSNFSAQLATLNPFEGQTVTISDMLPLNYKQSDFVSDLFKTFNLYCKVDKTNPTNLIIEDRPNFYSTTPVSWETKHAKDSEVEIIPLGELDFNVLKCRYSEDGDFYNKLSLDEFKDSYGFYQKVIQNDFIKNERIIQPSYAPTPYAVNNATGVVLPHILKKENNVVSPIKPKIRMLHWSGLITLPAGYNWTFTYNNGANSVVYTQQPHIGHSDNPYAPTLDLSWGVPKKVYFNYANAVWTTNNLYNKYYSQYFNQITDKNSKLIRTRFYLTANDIHIFDFQKPIFTIINGQQGYYLVNKIEDYNPLVNETTMVELLKLTAYDAFAAGEVVINPSDFNWGDQVGGGNAISGENNISNGNDSFISGGNNNFVSNDSSSVAIINSTNVTAASIENFMGVNLDSDSEVTDNMINLQDKVKIYSDGVGAIAPRVLRVTADFVVDGTYSIYEIDLDTGSGGLPGFNITATWDAVAYPVQVTFKVVSNAITRAFYIDDMTSPPSSPAQTIDGNAMPYTTGLVTNDSITVYSNGVNLKII